MKRMKSVDWKMAAAIQDGALTGLVKVKLRRWYKFIPLKKTQNKGKSQQRGNVLHASEKYDIFRGKK